MHKKTLLILMTIATIAKAVAACPALGFRPWSKQEEVMRCGKETRLLAWANRCGKTTVGAAEICLAGMGQHPWVDYPRPPFTIWAVSNNYKQMEDSIIPALEGDATHPRMLPTGASLNRQRMEYLLPSGSKIRLKSADSGRDAFQGAAIPLMWLDEDIDPVILKEIFIRIGPGFKRRILWTLTAVNGLTYSYLTFYKPWIAAESQGVDHPDIMCSVASMDESPYLDPQEIEGLLKFYPPKSKEYVVRRYGGFHDIAGDSVFPEDAILRHQKRAKAGEPMVVEYVGGDVRARPAEVGDAVMAAVWALPRRGSTYAIGADVAEGKLADVGDLDSERDFSAAVVLDRTRRTVVATLRCQIDPHNFALWLWLLGRWYNGAWICPELNHNGVAVLGVLRGTVFLPQAQGLESYQRIYARETHFDHYSDNIADDLLGWKTTVLTRPKMISDFYTFFVDASCTIYDQVMLEEAKTFRRGKTGKAEHTSGFHDDLLIAAMLALQADLQCPSGKPSELAETTGYVQTVFDPSQVAGFKEVWEHEYDDEEMVSPT